VTPAMPVAEVDQSASPAVFTRMVNLLDLCVLSVPNGFNDAGLPTPLHIICKDMTRLQRSALAELMSRQDWLARLPPGI